MRVVVATDAWSPQVNGVVRALCELKQRGAEHGLDLTFQTPLDFRTVPLPGYAEIRLALCPQLRACDTLERIKPDGVHIATEGPIGIAFRRQCLRRGIAFTTSYHTQFPQYLKARLPVPESLSYGWLRWFHTAGSGIMTATPSLDRDLSARGFGPLMRWSFGVDSSLFHPRARSVLDLERPIFLSVGRVAVEKNLEAFLRLDLPGSKVVVGDGPALDALKAAYPDVHFTGAASGHALASLYASADVFVFPSRTDTFGLVVVEALASGLPVAAFPVMGPKDILTDARVGCLDEDLRRAALSALTLKADDCVTFSRRYSWDASIAQFAANMRVALDRFKKRPEPRPAPAIIPRRWG